MSSHRERQRLPPRSLRGMQRRHRVACRGRAEHRWPARQSRDPKHLLPGLRVARGSLAFRTLSSANRPSGRGATPPDSGGPPVAGLRRMRRLRPDRTPTTTRTGIPMKALAVISLVFTVGQRRGAVRRGAVPVSVGLAGCPLRSGVHTRFTGVVGAPQGRRVAMVRHHHTTTRESDMGVQQIIGAALLAVASIPAAAAGFDFSNLTWNGVVNQGFLPSDGVSVHRWRPLQFQRQWRHPQRRPHVQQRRPHGACDRKLHAARTASQPRCRGACRITRTPTTRPTASARGWVSTT